MWSGTPATSDGAIKLNDPNRNPFAVWNGHYSNPNSPLYGQPFSPLDNQSVLQNFNIGNNGFDWTGLGTTIAGVGQGINAITGLGESLGLWKSPQTKLAEKNFKLQQEQYQYQKDLQQQIFEREDTAVRRAAADLESAGLSKTLAAGSGAGAGAVVSTTAPQQQGMPSDLQRHQQIESALQSLSTVLQLKHQELQNKYLAEQIKNQVVQNRIANLDEKWYTADKVAGYITNALGLSIKGVNAYGRIKSASDAYRLGMDKLALQSADPYKVYNTREVYKPVGNGSYIRDVHYNYSRGVPF